MIARHLIYTASVPGEIQGALRQVSLSIAIYSRVESRIGTFSARSDFWK